MHTNERANRTAKAHRYLVELQRTGIADADTLANLIGSDWDRIADILGEEPPSDLCKAEIIDIQRGRERFMVDTDDVFSLFR